MMYQLIKPFLFLFSPEKAHTVTTKLLHTALKVPPLKWMIRSAFTYDHPDLTQTIWGLTFKNPVGLAAGFDKNAELVDDFSHLGFGFIEIGTITPEGQPGNPQPRLFRLPKDLGLINRMGFNNDGVQAAVERLAKRKSNLIVGGNIGKNKVTPNEKALEDYLKCYHALYDFVDYFVVNVSSPNTPGLRELQEKEPLSKLLDALIVVNKEKPKKKPILLKIAPDLSESQLDDILELTSELELDGLIISNTTVERKTLSTPKTVVERIGAGGVSGSPVKAISNEVLRYIRQRNKEIPIVAVGGIMSASDALEKINAGANLVQIYTGLVYKGPILVKQINKALAHHLN